MEWQTYTALAIVLAGSFLLLRWKYRDMRRELTTGCGGNCACGSARRTTLHKHFP
jgi:hypothetical protein